MHDTNLKEKLKECRLIHDGMSDTEKVSSITKEIDNYLNFIEWFFSTKGEGLCIKKIYTKTDIDRDRRFKCIDLSKAVKVYSEYFEGMKKCITEIQDSNKEMDSFVDNKLDVFKKNDSQFICSLFGGSNNPETLMKQSDMVTNLEVLVDCVEKLNSLKNIYSSLKCGCSDVSDSLSGFMCDSLSSFMKKSSKVVRHTFEDLKGIVEDGRYPMRAKQEVEEFQLF